MSREIYSQYKASYEWYELYARARDYKDKDGNYRTDYVCLFQYGEGWCKKGDLIKIIHLEDESQNIYFHIEKAEDIKTENGSKYSLLTGYWVWSVYAGCVKSVDDLPTDAHEGEYYLIRKSDKTPIKDYKYYERVGDEWKPMGSYWR